jgi:hypothetical protein
MTENVGEVDRAIRLVLGLGLLSLIFLLDWPNKLFGIIGLVPLLTAGMPFCPHYSGFGIRTCARQADCAHTKGRRNEVAAAFCGF